ncbi:MAG TPA: tetratricopeptide repeat protein [Bryobacteraceae bacterium]|nr:tetratricopeptide repeat protein [Bryobacteraceae bacterium]
MRVVVCALVISCCALAQEANVERLFKSAVEAQQRGDLAAAIREYQQLLQVRPDALDARVNLAVALVRLGRFDEAIDEYRLALTIQPGNTAVRRNLALAYYKKGDFASALHEFDSLHRAAPGDARVAVLLADCYSRLGNNDEAITLLTPFEEAHPDDMDTAYVLGSALMQAGKLRKGAALLEQVGQRGKSADAYLMAGKARLKLNEFVQGRQDLEGAARLDTSLPGLFTALGIAKEQTSDEQGAESDLRKALASNPADFDANLHLGGILYGRRDLDHARPYIERALHIDPSSLFAHYELALCESAAGELEAAAADLEKVVQGDPKWLQAHVELAALYYKLRRPADGLKERQIVDRLTAEQQEQGPPRPPSP